MELASLQPTSACYGGVVESWARVRLPGPVGTTSNSMESDAGDPDDRARGPTRNGQRQGSYEKWAQRQLSRISLDSMRMHFAHSAWGPVSLPLGFRGL